MKTLIHSVQSPNWKRIAFWALIGIVSCVLMCVGARIDEQGLYRFGAVNAEIIEWVIIFSVLGFGRFALLGVDNTKKWLIVFSILGAFALTIGQACESTHSLAIFYLSKSGVIVGVLKCVGCSMFLYAISDFAFDIISRIRNFGCSVACEKRSCIWGGSRTRYLLIFLAVISTGWLLYFIVFFPGTIPADTSRQLAQYFGTSEVPLDNHFPFFTSVLYASLYTLGANISGACGVFVLTLFQFVIGILAFAVLLDFLMKHKAPWWLVFASVAFIALFPIIPTYVVSISKDYMHALCVMVFCVLLLDILITNKNNKKISLKQCGELLFISVLIVLTRNNGIIIVCFGLFGLMIALWKNTKICLPILCTIIVFSIGWNSALPLFGCAKGEVNEMLSVPAQIVARSVATNAPLDDEINDKINSFLAIDREKYGKSYNPELADNAKTSSNINISSTSDAIQFSILSLEIARQHPGLALSAWFDTCYGWWYPSNIGSFWDECYPYWINYNDPFGLLSTWYDEPEEWVAQYSKNARPVADLLNGLHKETIFISYLGRAGTYVWLIAFMLAVSLQKKERRIETLIATFPLIAMLLVFQFGPCASLRYTLPLIFSLPLLAWLLLYPYSSNASKCD